MKERTLALGFDFRAGNQTGIKQSKMPGRGGKRPGAGRKSKKTADPVPAVQETVEQPAEDKSLAISLLRACSAREQAFILELVAHPELSNYEAYRRAGFKSTEESARANAHKVLRRDRVSRALDALRIQSLESKVEAALMSGDEALEQLSSFARADIGALLPDDDPLKQLPSAVRRLVKAVRPTRYGRVIELHDAMRATELMAKAGGKLTEKHEHKFTYEDIVCGLNPPKPEGASA